MKYFHSSVFFVFFSLEARRLHDLNHPGWIAGIYFAPFTNVLLAVYLFFGKGTLGANHYGPDPLKYPTYSSYIEALSIQNKSKINNF